MVTVFHPRDLFELADRIEKRGRIFYERMSRDAATPRSRQLFERLAREESAHEEEFRKITGEALAMPFEIPDGYVSPELTAYLEALHEGRAFIGSVDDQSRPVGTEKEALLLAVAYEKDSILLLYEMYDVVPPSMPARKAIADLIRAEKGQLARICGMLGYVKK